MEGDSMNTKHMCQYCADDKANKGLPFAYAEQRYSFGCYAGRYCDACWRESGYRDATDPDAEFDPDYAGERIEPLD
jgi:hypothetical protein